MSHGHFCFAHGLVFWIIPCAALLLWQLWQLPAVQQFRLLCCSAAVVAASGPGPFKTAAVPPDTANAAQTGGSGGEASGVD